MSRKKCFKCGEVKSLSAFYKHPKMADGHVNKCKECNKHDVRKNRNDKIDYYREYDKARSNRPDRVRARREFARTEAGKACARKAMAKYLESNQIKRAAHIIAGNALRRGDIKKAKLCDECKKSHKRLHGHHDDYANPLEVRWLCPKCHAQWHKINGEGKNAF